MSKLEVINLSKSFGKTKVLDNISFEVNDGEFLSLLGPSGCGKTTILKIITGLETPDSGDILVNGKSVLKMPTENRNIGMVFQNYALFPNMNVIGNVSYGLKVRHENKKMIKEKTEKILNLVEMSEMAKRKVTMLSGGQQQRVALARALIVEPDILLLDEPLSALDHKIRVEMQNEIRTIQKKLGITTIFVTHDQEEAMSMSDRIILMNSGKIEQHDDPKTLYNNPSTVFASDFLGRANFFKGKISNGKIVGEGFNFEIENNNSYKDGEDVVAAVRGENFEMAEAEEDGDNVGTIKDSVFMGSLVKFKVALKSETAEILTLGKESGRFKIGEKVRLSVNPSNIKIFR